MPVSKGTRVSQEILVRKDEREVCHPRLDKERYRSRLGYFGIAALVLTISEPLRVAAKSIHRVIDFF